jgi:UDP-N-acetylglucosamine acyltransferase
MNPLSDVHPTAVVSGSARLGAGVVVGPYAVIEDDADVGDGTELRAHVVIKRFTTIGKGNTVHEAAILGGEPQDLGFAGAETRLRIGDGNRIREGVTIHRATRPGGETVVGSGCFLMAYAHVAHECLIGDGAILANNVALAGHVDIGPRAFLSGGVVVHQFCRVGRLAMLGGNSKIVQDCLPFVITDGVPGRARGLNVVGLRRAGVAAAQLRTLKEGYRLLLRSSLRLETALERMAGLDDPWVDEMIAFVRGSKRGFHRAARDAGTAT